MAGPRWRPVGALKGLKDRFPRAGAGVGGWSIRRSTCGMGGEDGSSLCLDIVCKPKGQIGFSVLPWPWIVERTFAWLGNYRRLARGLRDQSTHERGLDQNRDDSPYGAKARLSILRQVLSVKLHRLARKNPTNADLVWCALA